jgi:post-segregation antitoxin (ccd killing protein)
MGKKKNIMVYVDEEIAREAKELGLNISKTCEIALKQAIERLRPLYAKNKDENSPDTHHDSDVGAAAGIRTRVVGSGSRSPNQVFQLAHFALISRLRPPQMS